MKIKSTVFTLVGILIWTACSPLALPTAPLNTPVPQPTTSTVSPTANVPPTESATEAGPNLPPIVQPPSPNTQATSNLESLPNASLTTFPEAESVSVAANAESIYVLIGHQNYLFLSQSNSQTIAFNEPVHVTRSAPALVMSVERPALALGDENRVGVAWIYNTGQENEIWYESSSDGGTTFRYGTLQYDTRAREVAMVGLTFDSQIRPGLVWLENGQLMWLKWLEANGQSGTVFAIDEQVCDCCQPQVVNVGSNVYVAYRNAEPDSDGRTIRDVFLVRSTDEGVSFEEPVRVADGHWYLDACPIAGPALHVDSTHLFMAWMDARNDTSGTLAHSDIWFAYSTDEGQSFSPNLRVSTIEGYYNTLPVMAVGPNGRIHLVWEAHDAAQSLLFYTTSDDHGQTFATPRIIVDKQQTGQERIGKPTLSISPDGQVVLGWIHRAGVQLAIWRDTQ